ncbi:MAG: galactokinase, partial [Oscillospiraceae bacterium]
DVVCLNDLEPLEKEINKSTSLVRGVCAKFNLEGFKIGGFDAYTTSDVLKGSGLSSSAAYEVLVGTMINGFYNDNAATPTQIAQFSQFAENVYFGKASGLLDQLTCSVGSFITVDFKNPATPIIKKVDFDFAKSGYDLCIVDTKGSHSDLSDDYSQIPAEMKSVAKYFGKEVLREVCEDEFYNKIAMVRAACGDRAVLRAIHFFEENCRVDKQAAALLAGDFEEFKNEIIKSGNSSYKYLQNVYTNSHPNEQGLSIALCVAQRLLDGSGAYRVHGGGFAGTIQAFVPKEKTEEFSKQMNNIFGSKSCHVLSVRPCGGIEIVVK